MTKRQIVKWLEKKEAEALENATAQYVAAKEEHKEKLHTELELIPLATKVQGLLDQADDIMKAWKEKFKDKVDMTQSYSGVSSKLYDLVKSPDSTLRRIIDYDFADTTKEMQALNEKNKKVREEIKKNYANVTANVQNMKDAKSGITYLQELGFDLTELIDADERPVTTALAIEVNKQFLFVQGVDEV